jgi:hypothetical protein
MVNYYSSKDTCLKLGVCRKTLQNLKYVIAEYLHMNKKKI